jgi:carbon-monoxide dehydrogenase medium subunit
MYNFEFTKPKTVEEAVNAMAAEGAQALGGGQTLLPTMKQRLASPEVLVSLTDVEGMVGVSAQGNTITIGGSTTHAQVAADTAKTFPALSALADGIGDPAVRNRGTIGGSLANNDPAACYPAGALGSGATITTNKRDIAADDYFQGLFETALDEDEIITSVSFPVAEKANYQKFDQPASRFALVGVFVAKSADGVRVAVTGASNEGVYRWTDAEAALNEDFSQSAIDGMSGNADDMISDLHGSAEYRAHLVGVLTRRAVAACG